MDVMVCSLCGRELIEGAISVYGIAPGKLPATGGYTYGQMKFISKGKILNGAFGRKKRLAVEPGISIRAYYCSHCGQINATFTAPVLKIK